MKRILITGAGGSAGTNFIESLRLAPEKIYIGGTDSSKYYRYLSKADKTWLVLPYNHKDYLANIIAVVDRAELEFVHAQPDPEVKVISDNRSTVSVRTFLPSKETIDISQDKYRFNKLMEKNNVPIPKTWEITKIPDIWGTQKLWLRANKGAGSLAALPVTNPNQINMWIDYWYTRGLTREDFMLSEFLPGKEYAFQSLWKGGELIVSAARQRIEYLFQSRMPSGQSSTPTIAKSVHNEKVNEVATKAVKALDPKANGIFCVDLKENKDGIPCVTEINAGRFFTTSLFFTKAGCNMPYYYVKLAYGEKLPKLPKYNAVPKDLYWIRQIDCGEIMVKGEELEQ